MDFFIRTVLVRICLSCVLSEYSISVNKLMLDRLRVSHQKSPWDLGILNLLACFAYNVTSGTDLHTISQKPSVCHIDFDLRHDPAFTSDAVQITDE